MKANLLHLGRLLVNRGGTLFGLKNLRLNLRESEVEEILEEIETKIYGKQGIDLFESNTNSEIKRLLLRSLAQYLCQCKLYKSKLTIFIREAFFVFFFLGIALYLLIGMPFIQRKTSNSDTDVVIIYHYAYLKNLVTDLFADKRVVFVEKSKMQMNFGDIRFFIRCLICYPRLAMLPHFLFSLLKWISYYSYIVRKYKPEALVNFMDGSFISSIMTAYLREHSVTHINHMHGERFFMPNFAFFEFDYSYVYGQYWADMFRRLKCRAGFIIKSNPYYKRLYDMRFSGERSKSKRVLITHNQLFSYGSKEYGFFLRVLKNIPEDSEIRFRFHPNEKKSGINFFNYLKNEEFLQNAGIVIKIDDFQENPIDRSLAMSRVVIGQTSAALFEAWISGCKVIYLDETNDLKTRYNCSENVLFIKSDSTDKEITDFLLNPPVISKKEDDLVDHVSKSS